MHYIYRFTAENNRRTPRAVRLRSEVHSHNDLTRPLRVAVVSDLTTLNWRIPISEEHIQYDIVERTLVLDGNLSKSHHDHEQLISVVLSTSSEREVNFTISLSEVNDFFIPVSETEEKKVANVVAHSPKYYYIDLGKEWTTVKVKSADEVCAIVSLQRPGRPLLNTEDVIRNDGSTFQSMLRLASFHLNKDDYGDGVFIMFLVSHNDSLCGNDAKPTLDRAKNFTFSISEPITRETLILECVMRVALSLIVAIVFLSFHFSCHSLNTGSTLDMLIKHIFQTEGLLLQENEDMQALPEHKEQDEDEATQECRTTTVISGVITTDHERGLGEEEKEWFSKTISSTLHSWLVIIIGLFFAVPAIQITYSQNYLLLTTGDEDICYFNYRCANPIRTHWIEISDFNHVFSNIHYVIFGFVVLILAWDRRRGYKRFLQKLKDNNVMAKYGLQQDQGVYYAMGIAIMFEGLLSAIYHICPTDRNFQFDTVFMYIISILMVNKIYQFRHRDLVAKAHMVYVCLGFVVLVEVIGIYSEIGFRFGVNEVFARVTVLVAHFLSCMTMAFLIYYPGQFSLFSLNRKVFRGMYKSLYNLAVHRECSLSRRHAISLAIGFGINALLIAYGVVKQPGIATYLLYVFVFNMLVYFGYYIAMKLWLHLKKGVRAERITTTTWVCLFLTVASSVPALYFFSMKVYKPSVTPAESRNLNEECLVPWLSYDNHDVWHMLSALALFLTVYSLMTLDNELFKEPRNNISKF